MNDLASLIGCSFGRNCEELRRRAPAWGPVLGPLVLGVLDDQDERDRQHAAEAERSRQEALQAREAAKMATAELKRIRAKRARRAALARLQRKYEERCRSLKGRAGTPANWQRPSEPLTTTPELSGNAPRQR